MALEYDVWIVISSTCGENSIVFQQLEWIKNKLGNVWFDKAIVCKDKTLLKASYLFDPQPHPDQTTLKLLQHRKTDPTAPVSSTPEWEHILIDRPYNHQITQKRRLHSWKNWKSALSPGSDLGAGLCWFHHGSADSVDEDKLYVFESMPKPKECRQFLSGVTEDRNIIVLKNGFVSACYKGFPDEIQNALIETYSLHPQDYPLPLTNRMTRIVISKLVTALYGILIRLVNCNYKDAIKAALKSGHFGHRKKVVLSMDFTTILDLRTDDYKFVAFQFGQTLALIDGIEIYTKKKMVEQYPTLEPFIYRNRELILQNLKILNNYRDMIADRISSLQFKQKQDLCIFYSDTSLSVVPNHLLHESNGLVVDLHSQQVVCYPFAHIVPHPSPSWPTDAENELPQSILIEKGTLISIFSYKNIIYSATREDFGVDMACLKDIALDVSKLKLDEYYYILLVVDKEAYLVGMRDKVSLKLESKQIVGKRASELGIKVLPS
eukprot:TRINITY_DN20264_c0_g1_i1.p1 TRINITY_DN20264_c0_g1~~TRINITY_DN20264_c0_g1_i1.p1  ORF type:complete len:571 (-),score=143.74 TRINITY_DN20264_c0_g1_i1:18-1493(-)